MKQIVGLLAACALAACGFSPVYGGAPAGGTIAVDDIAGRSGHELRKALLIELGAGLPGVDSASLNVVLDEELQRLALRPDAAASRTDIRAVGKYVLTLNDTTIAGNARVETSYNVPDAPYADIAAQTDASKRAMKKLANGIVDDIRLKLAQKK